MKYLIRSVSRVDSLLSELHSNPDAFLSDPHSSEEPSFTTWQQDFSADKSTDEIAALLERYPDLRSQMDSLVPEKVSYKDFWMRYLYQKSKIDKDEARRKQLFESNHDENDFDWDGDDEADDTQHGVNHTRPTAFNREGETSTEKVKPRGSTTGPQTETAPRKSSTSESSASFDIVSQSSAIPPVTMEKVNLNSNPYWQQQVPQSREESDDDWE